MNSPLSNLYSNNELDPYVSELGSYTGKHFDSADDLTAWVYQHTLSMSGRSSDPVLAYLTGPDDVPSELLQTNRSTNRPTFNNNEVDGLVNTMLMSHEQSNPSRSNDEIFFEPSLFSECPFGDVEVASDIANIEPEPMMVDFDFELETMAMEKSEKMKKGKPEKTEKAKRASYKTPIISVDEWLILDETSGRPRRPLLHEFLRQILDNGNYSHIAAYVDRKRGIFKFHQKKVAAELWQYVKGRNSDSVMTYEKLARAIRYYYSSGIICPTPGRFTFRFGAESGFGKTWRPA